MSIITSRKSTFDIIKGLACVSVVLIHYGFAAEYKWLGDVIKVMCRWAVPFFFAVSGYFLLSNGVLTAERLIKKIKHITKILFWSGFFYAVFVFIWNLFISHISSAEFVAMRLTAPKIVRFIVINQPFYCLPLWFLLALFYCYFFSIFFLCDRIKICKWIVASFAGVLLIGMCLSQEFYKVLGFYPYLQIPGTKERMNLNCLFIFRALPFFLFGVFFRLMENRLRSLVIPSFIYVAIAVMGCGISVWEHYFIGVTSQFYCGSYLTAASLFMLAICKPNWKCPWLEFIGRELSLYVYVFHVAVAMVYLKIASNVWPARGALFELTKPIVVVFLTLLVSFVFNYVIRLKTILLIFKKSK